MIDALLFVFGFRAKDLRMTNSEQLIHKSEEHPDVDYANVTINFAIIDDKVSLFIYSFVLVVSCIGSIGIFRQSSN